MKMCKACNKLKKGQRAKEIKLEQNVKFFKISNTRFVYLNVHIKIPP